ncbi:putative TRANSPARENT TESTA 12 protein [Hibiscus syriacus]|uniref:TRANSPARENT TESTA 12 protein n=1 Tax=Hibiscus syriacus TaxID=106335 RepID=A0A6A2ZD49_HIBSY|nr:U-box domain-containing protein 4-like [Hibiscus syriacus]XP_039016408.1 U-box domain-containing protein 4-like [Hibiscus syriacus]XP_039016409.1 U-box domain-containing protein 4-like [Hibiscus syriacus]KAE8689667.1 putative TRANSPARENT TESTA 12 protein [Hibiscus syriacus]
MVSLQDSHSNSNPFPLGRNLYTPGSASTTRIHRHAGRSMRTIRSNFYQSADNSSCSFTSSVPDPSSFVSENLTESVIDMRLGELVAKNNAKSVKSESENEYFLDISQAFSDFSACSSDISGELQRLATLPSLDNVLKESNGGAESEPEPEPCHGFLQRENFSSEIIESISPEDLQPTVKICIDGLQSPSVAVKRSAAAKLRLLAKNRVDNRALIGESGAIPALIPLLRNSDPWTQEHAVTALLNLSLFEANKSLIINGGAIKSLVYVLKTGTETSKQNAACALLSLALIDENKTSIGACGAIPPLVSLLMTGSNRGKKDALTTLYKLCSARQNKERAVSAGAVRPLVGMVGEQGTGMSEKAMVVLSSLAGIKEGREAIVEDGGIAALVEAIEDGSVKGKEFAVLTLLQLCADNIRNRGLLVREGGIPPLVALSQTGSIRAKHKAETLLGYLREPRQDASSSSP